MSLILSGTSGLSDVDGSAATPAIRGVNASTGIFFPAADTIGFAEGGVEAMRLDSSGNLGIGTSSPAYKLTTSGSAQLYTSAAAIAFYDTAAQTNSRNWIIGNIAAGGYGDFTFSSSTSAGGAPTTQRMTLDYAGNLGLGVTPSAWSGGKAIQVKNSSNPIFISETAGDGWFGYNSYYNGTNWIYVGSYYANALKMADGQFQFMQAASGTAGNAITFTQAMTLDASGNFGLGSTSPSSFSGSIKAVIGTAATSTTSAGLTLYTGTATYGGLYFADGTIGDQLYRGAVEYNHSSDALLLYSAGAERARIDSSGNLLVGTTSQIQSGKQTISFNASTHNGLVLSDSNNTTSGRFISFNLAGTSIGSIERVGATSAVVYNTTSDQRLKSNITNANPILDKLMTVKVRQYDWTEGSLHQDYGFIAQELEPTLSGVVTKGKTDDDMWQLDYSRLTPHLVKAIQEQQALITQLQADVAALKGAA